MINLSKLFKNDADSPSRLILPTLPLRDMVVFPHMVAPLFAGRKKSINALTEAMNRDRNIFLVSQLNPAVEDPEEKDINAIGTIGKVLQILKLPDGNVKALIEGHVRARITEFTKHDDFFETSVEVMNEKMIAVADGEALSRAILESFREYAEINKKIPKEATLAIGSIEDPSRLVDVVSAQLPFRNPEKQRILEEMEVEARLNHVLELINTEIEIFRVDQKIKGRVKTQMENVQKKYYLNEQMRAIKREMGEEETDRDELSELEKRIKKKKMSKEGTAKAKHEFDKLRQMSPMSAEAAISRNYIDWLLSLPWCEKSKISHDLDAAEAILNEDHYGLQKPKERIVEYLAVQALVEKIRGPILCFVGPPGVGKTSLAKSVARATGRKYIRISLGGVKDEAEIRGHRRTYVGALPGKIIQSLKKAGVNNPVVCLDEVDKMTMDFRGDPSSALLEVLDPEQNNAFNDHYLDVDYDLSDIMFITTANTLPDIPLPLQDRMEIIRIAGYTEHEKYEIAVRHLLPKQIEANGLDKEYVQFTTPAIYKIIREFTREAGVRNMEREIASICRKIAREQAKDKNNKKKFEVKSSLIIKYLGPPKFRIGYAESTDQIGIVTGMAWTQTGGELLCVEAVAIPGKGEFIVTGKLGDVMKESARAAVSYVRSRCEALNIDVDFYKSLDLHIHIPEGAIPKDGPSAGIAMCTAIVSVLTKCPVDRTLAMTGEITLRGRILPIGGLRDKILAAHRGGIKKIIVPRENERDLAELPAAVAKQLEIKLVDHMDEVLATALLTRSVPMNSSIYEEKNINLT